MALILTSSVVLLYASYYFCSIYKFCMWIESDASALSFGVSGSSVQGDGFLEHCGLEAPHGHTFALRTRGI